MICNQDGCEEPAAFRFTWPGKDEDGICGGHVDQLRGLASAMGLHLEVIPIDADPIDGLIEKHSDPLLRFFRWDHLPEHLRGVSKPFGQLALELVELLPANREREKSLDLLLAAKDAAVRAALP